MKQKPQFTPRVVLSGCNTVLTPWGLWHKVYKHHFTSRLNSCEPDVLGRHLRRLRVTSDLTGKFFSKLKIRLPKVQPGIKSACGREQLLWKCVSRTRSHISTTVRRNLWRELARFHRRDQGLNSVLGVTAVWAVFQMSDYGLPCIEISRETCDEASCVEYLWGHSGHQN